ncbi:MAG: hypothetical protein ACJ76N_15440 [Thermoanaerobaculia bacterium]
MKGWMTVGVVTAAVLLTAGQARAQSSRDRYDDEDAGGSRHRDRFALGVGIGLVEPLNKVETYYMASLRIRTSGREGDRDRRATGDEGITGYLEPEVGYWTSSGGRNNPKGSDTLLGVNLIGVVPLGSVDSFFGVGAGAHFVDASVLTNNASVTGSETKFGANAQFGIDLYINRKLSAFGVGRFDLVQGADSSIQSKVYLGLRARF